MHTRPVAAGISFKFKTMDDPYYTSFNRLTGINNDHRITGYEGIGGTSYPSEGYKIYPPYEGNNYRKVEYPDALQTVATSLNNRRMVAGFFVNRRGITRGFVDWKGIWSSYADPIARHGGPTELLSLNDSGIAVGMAKDGNTTHAFELNIGTDDFEPISPPGGKNPIATGIDGPGDIVGYVNRNSGSHAGFLLKSGKYKMLSYPGSTDTEFLGITVYDQIVGSFVDALGVTHGFLLRHPSYPRGTTWQQIDFPYASATTVTSINLHDEIVGWYVDQSGINHGFIGTP